MGRRSRLIYAGRLILGIAIVYFVSTTVGVNLKNIFSLKIEVASADLLASLTAYLGSLLVSLEMWHRIYAHEDPSTSRFSDYWFVMLTQLSRYIPGKLFVYVHQLLIANDLGLSKERAVTVTLIHDLMFVASGVLVFASVTDLFSIPIKLAIIASIVGLMFIDPKIVFRLVRKLPVIKNFPTSALDVAGGKKLVRFVPGFIVIWILLSISFYYGSHAVFVNAFTLVAATATFSLSWLVGFLTFISPSGIGTREGSLVFLLKPYYTSEQALTLAILSRVVFTVGEFITLGVVYSAHKIKERLGRKELSRE